MEIAPKSPIVATEPSQLPSVVDLIHDYWFDAEEIAFDAATRTLVIPFARPPAGVMSKHLFLSKIREPGYVEAFLRIHRVRNWRMKDTNKVRFYDFNELEFDAKRNLMRITTGVPILVEAEVECLEVSVDISNKPCSGD